MFLRTLGVIHLIAFVSLWTQLNGLVGSHGILPAADLMESARNWAANGHAGDERYWLLPTLCWFSASDAFLRGLCAAGTVLSLLLIVGVAPAIVLFLLWAIYLSLVVVCGEFLSFQWDMLLLETTFLAIFFAPLQLMPKFSREEPPSKLVLWMLRWLLFRLMFSSGLVKLLSGDVLWHNLTALTVHYETQPLPTWIGWYAHQLPVWFQKFSCAVMFGIELGMPMLIFGPRKLRYVAAGAFTILMILIALTGNYCFFNLLALALSVTLLDDGAIRWCCKRFRLPEPPGTEATTARWPRRVRTAVFVPVMSVILFVTVMQLLSSSRTGHHWPRPMLRKYYETYQTIAPYRTVNTYGLFAVMTPSRPEIIVEGSNDGLTWLPYEFKCKPGDLTRRPRFVEPHQPRLDWQMWFAALGNYQGNEWFIAFCAKLLKGSPETLALLANNPFPTAPPRYIRAVLYDYRFTDFATRRATGQWWRRELRGLYCPILSTKDS
jgi:hypothetical protein